MSFTKYYSLLKSSIFKRISVAIFINYTTGMISVFSYSITLMKNFLNYSISSLRKYNLIICRWNVLYVIQMFLHYDWSIKFGLVCLCIIVHNALRVTTWATECIAGCATSCISQIRRDVITVLLYWLKSEPAHVARLNPHRLRKDFVASRCSKFKDRVSLWYSRTPCIVRCKFLTYRRVSGGSAKSLRTNGLALLTQSHREARANFSSLRKPQRFSSIWSPICSRDSVSQQWEQSLYFIKICKFQYSTWFE